MDFTITHAGLLAAGFGGPFWILALAVVPLGAAFVLLAKALRGTPATLAADATANDLSAIRNELLANYERLRGSPVAVPLVTTTWGRLGRVAGQIPAELRASLDHAYRAIVISNRLLLASNAYDSRGHLSQRQRQMALWPTLESAVRSALGAMDCPVAKARQTGPRAATQPAAQVPEARPARAAVGIAAAVAPRLSLFHGERAKVGERTAACDGLGAQRRPRRVSGPTRSPSDGQMRLWESVA